MTLDRDLHEMRAYFFDKELLNNLFAQCIGNFLRSLVSKLCQRHRKKIVIQINDMFGISLSSIVDCKGCYERADYEVVSSKV